MSDELLARPNNFVALIPSPWTRDESALIAQTHAEVWMSPIEVEFTEEDGRLGGAIRFEDQVHEVKVLVEEPIPELVSLAGLALEPYGPAEALMLEQHTSIWRLVMAPTELGVRLAATRFTQLLSTFIEAGASGVFLPNTVTLHSPRTIKRQAMDPTQVGALTNLFVACFHADDWMRTRGLTAFGLPELETPVDEGLNAAYFRLMDIAANMIAQEAPFPVDGQLTMGPKLCRIAEGPHGPADEQVPINGHFGVQSIVPA